MVFSLYGDSESLSHPKRGCSFIGLLSIFFAYLILIVLFVNFLIISVASNMGTSPSIDCLDVLMRVHCSETWASIESSCVNTLFLKPSLSFVSLPSSVGLSSIKTSGKWVLAFRSTKLKAVLSC